MLKLDDYRTKKNSEFFHPKGLELRDPGKSGYLCLEIKIRGDDL
jgi:hypothetical protein